MSRYIKHFDNGGKNMSFKIEDESVYLKNHYICIAAICIDSALRIEKKNYPQVYLEQCKYKTKKRELVDFIGAEVDLSSDDSDHSDDLNE